MCALFARSTLGSATAVQQIADSAGASADAQMTARAGVSLKAAYQHFNNLAYWEWAKMEAPTILVTGPFALTAATVSATGGGSALTFVSTGHGFEPDDLVTGPMFAVPVRLTVTGATAIGFGETINPSLWSTAGATASGAEITATRDFYNIPSNWKHVYLAKLLQAPRALQPIGRRLYDRGVVSEFSATTPMYYDLFGIAERSKIRLLGPPSATDRLQLRYYRRMDYTANPLDFPEPYEPYLIAFAKWHFLLDKADSAERRGEWKEFFKEGVAQMLKDNITTPDDNAGFTPGIYSYSFSQGPNSVYPWINE